MIARLSLGVLGPTRCSAVPDLSFEDLMLTSADCRKKAKEKLAEAVERIKRAGF